MKRREVDPEWCGEGFGARILAHADVREVVRRLVLLHIPLVERAQLGYEALRAAVSSVGEVLHHKVSRLPLIVL